MAIVLESTGTAVVGTGTTATTTAPSGLANGDLEVMPVGTSLQFASPAVTGWTLQASVQDAAPKTTSAIFYKRADGTARDTPVVSFGGSRDYVVPILRLSGVHPTPADVSATNSVSATTITVPVVVTNFDNSFLVCIITTDGQAISTPPGNGWTSRASGTVAGGSGIYCEIFTKSTTTAGSYGGETVTFAATDQATAVTFAIREGAYTQDPRIRYFPLNDNAATTAIAHGIVSPEVGVNAILEGGDNTGVDTKRIACTGGTAAFGLRLNGVDDAINLLEIFTITTTGTGSMAIRFRQNSTATIILLGQTSNGDGFSKTGLRNGVIFTFNSGADTLRFRMPSLSKSVDDWNQVLITWSAGVMRMFGNGVESLDGPQAFTANCVFNYIGRKQSFFSACDFAEFQMWNNNQSANTVALYVAGGVPISIASQQHDQIIQRRADNTANITVSGVYDTSLAPTGITAQLGSNPVQLIAANPSGGTYSGMLTNQPVGQGDLVVKFLNDATKTATRLFVGVGKIYVIAGQSNAVSLGDNQQTYSHATLKAGMFSNANAWQDAVDDLDEKEGQVYLVSLDGTTGGHWAMKMATDLMAEDGIPVSFIPCAKTSTTIEMWQPDYDEPTGTPPYGVALNLFNTMSDRIDLASADGTCELMLWHQGEGNLTTPSATYAALLSIIAQELWSRHHCEVMGCKLHSHSGQNRVLMWDAMEMAWQLPHINQGPDFSAISLGGGAVPDLTHMNSDVEIQTAGSMWAAKAISFSPATIVTSLDLDEQQQLLIPLI